jgi:DNA polymerase-3 subunit alpha
MASIDKVVEYVEETRAMGISVLPPDVNRSRASFTVENDAVRYGMAGIRGVGAHAVDALCVVRDSDGTFKDVFDLCARVDPGDLNKGVITAMIHAGALDSLPANRARKGVRPRRRDFRGRLGGARPAIAAKRRCSATPNPARARGVRPTRRFPNSTNRSACSSKDALGFYLTGHPLNRHRKMLQRFSTSNVKALPRTRRPRRNHHRRTRAQGASGGDQAGAERGTKDGRHRTRRPHLGLGMRHPAEAVGDAVRIRFARTRSSS